MAAKSLSVTTEAGKRPCWWTPRKSSTSRAAGQRRRAEPLGQFAVAARAAEAVRRERLAARLDHRRVRRLGDVQLRGADGGLGELTAVVDADAVLVGHAAADVSLDGDAGHDEQRQEGDDRGTVVHAVAMPAHDPVRRGGDGEDRHGDAEPEMHVAEAEVLPTQCRLRLAPDEQARETRGRDADDRRAERPRFGTDDRRAATSGPTQEVEDREERDRDDRQVRGGAVQLGEVGHRRSLPTGGSRFGKGLRHVAATSLRPDTIGRWPGC